MSSHHLKIFQLFYSFPSYNSLLKKQKILDIKCIILFIDRTRRDSSTQTHQTHNEQTILLSSVKISFSLIVNEVGHQSHCNEQLMNVTKANICKGPEGEF